MLADGLLLLFGEVAEDFVVQRLPELRDHIDQALTVDQLFHHLQQVEHDRRAHLRQVQKLGGVEGDHRRRVQVRQLVVGLVEHPAQGTPFAPAPEPLVQTVFTRLRQVLPNRREAAQSGRHGGHRLDGIGNGALIGRQQGQGGRGDADTDQLFPELDTCWRGVALQRVQVGRLARFEGEIAAVQGPNRDLATPVQVEQHQARRRVPLAGEREQEHLQSGLANAGGSDDEGVAGQLLVGRVFAFRAAVQVQIEGLARWGAQQGQRFSPGVAVALTPRKVVTAGQGSKGTG